MRTKEAFARIVAVETARHRGEVELARSAEEARRYHVQLESREPDLKRVQAEVVKLDQQKQDLKESTAETWEMSQQH